jgi:hypothetical protein
MSGKSTSNSTIALIMFRQYFLLAFKRACYFLTKLRRPAAGISLALSGAMSLASGAGFAQITQGSGSSQQENRTSAMGAAPDPAASAVHESTRPQTKDGGSKGERGKTGGKGHPPHGAGSFDNGLYGTGAGSNK